MKAGHRELLLYRHDPHQSELVGREQLLDLISIVPGEPHAEPAVRAYVPRHGDEEKPTRRLQNPAALTLDELAAEVRKARGRGQGLTTAGIRSLREEYESTIVPLRSLAAEMTVHERRVSDLVNEAYGLTEHEAKVLWRTAPPRMPLPPPPSPS